MRGAFVFVALLFVVLPACRSDVSIEGLTFSCELNSQCGAGMGCQVEAGQTSGVCVPLDQLTNGGVPGDAETHDVATAEVTEEDSGPDPVEDASTHEVTAEDAASDVTAVDGSTADVQEDADPDDVAADADEPAPDVESDTVEDAAKADTTPEADASTDGDADAGPQSPNLPPIAPGFAETSFRGASHGAGLTLRPLAVGVVGTSLTPNKSLTLKALP